MLAIECDRCRRELKEAGALIFAPPLKQYVDNPSPPAQMSRKWHLCRLCYLDLVDQFLTP